MYAMTMLWITVCVVNHVGNHSCRSSLCRPCLHNRRPHDRAAIVRKTRRSSFADSSATLTCVRACM